VSDFERIRGEITRDNAVDLLRQHQVACRYCGCIGDFELFDEPANNGVGLLCHHCGNRHPLMDEKIQWLRGDTRRRANDIARVMQQCGTFCYGCGQSYEKLSNFRIGFHVHHTRPFADHGEQYPKIPMCSVCHEINSATQRFMRRLMDGVDD